MYIRDGTLYSIRLKEKITVNCGFSEIESEFNESRLFDDRSSVGTFSNVINRPVGHVPF